ncbi:hypothetical protein EC919_1095 [Pseudomonas graminis]|nr:hypothetical protein EC919_1095 [Pseudomonas graminis]
MAGGPIVTSDIFAADPTRSPASRLLRTELDRSIVQSLRGQARSCTGLRWVMHRGQTQNRRSRLAGERGGSEPEVSTDETGSPASWLLRTELDRSIVQSIRGRARSCTGFRWVMHRGQTQNRRSRRAGERGGSEPEVPTDETGSPASRLLRIELDRSIVQSIRGKARSCTGLRWVMHRGQTQNRRSRLAGERGGSEPEVSTDETGSPASRLLRIELDRSIVQSLRGQARAYTGLRWVMHRGQTQNRRSRLAGERGGSEPEVPTDETGSPASRLLRIALERSTSQRRVFRVGPGFQSEPLRRTVSATKSNIAAERGLAQ